MAKGKVSDNHVERQSLTKEIAELKNEIQSHSNEAKEATRIEQQSLPQLKQLLSDLEAQLEQQKINPIVKYGLLAPEDQDTSVPSTEKAAG